MPLATRLHMRTDLGIAALRLAEWHEIDFHNPIDEIHKARIKMSVLMLYQNRPNP